MNGNPARTPLGPVVYPDSDGKPLADNSLQLEWIVYLYTNLRAQFVNSPNVFVGSDLLWYPIKGQDNTKNAPDALVVFDRPQGYRGSYKQWEENDVPITVAFEVLSPSNTKPEMANKRAFYEDHGVEEYYVINPETNRVEIYVRRRTVFRRERKVEAFVSPRLGIRFKGMETALVVLKPNGEEFLEPEQVLARYPQLQSQLEEEHQLRLLAEQRATNAEQRATNAEQQLQRLRRLNDLGRKARLQQITPTELVELERLEQEEFGE